MLWRQTILLLLLLLWPLLNFAQRNSLKTYVKFTNIKCNSTNPHLMSFETCTFERTPNASKVMTLCKISEKPLSKLNVGIQCFRKRANGYVPFVIDLKLNWCDFLERRNNEVMQRMFGLFENFSNINTKCPIYIDYTYVNLTLLRSGGFRLPFKFPSGDYRIDIRINANTAIKLLINTYFQIDS